MWFATRRRHYVQGVFDLAVTMNATSCVQRTLAVLIAGYLFSGPAAMAHDYDPQSLDLGIRWEGWLALTSWPSLSDLEPVAGGSFDDVGFGLGFAAYWPISQLENAEFMLGVEGAVMATDSDVPVVYDDLVTRVFYAAVSAKWIVGEARNVSLDGGLGYYLADIAQLENDYDSWAEFESWEEGTAGAFIGATWDVGATREGPDSGLSLGLRVHMVDFGVVNDEEIFGSPILGPDAGDLDGPLYVLQIGYRWR